MSAPGVVDGEGAAVTGGGAGADGEGGGLGAGWLGTEGGCEGPPREGLAGAGTPGFGGAPAGG
ncbi:single-stranded DNA-binding protein, partial [Streptomyces sp. NPDC059928]